jgi:hypothetical protein
VSFATLLSRIAMLDPRIFAMSVSPLVDRDTSRLAGGGLDAPAR